jgi:UDP-N-acetylglucosamine 4,6-dehydratase
MTRFWLSLEQGVDFTIRCIEQMQGGEVFVPKIPSTHITDLAKVIAPEAEIEYIGIRPGEKLHEVLISEDEARHTLELDDMFVVEPSGALWFGHDWREQGAPLPKGFRYTSDSNTEWLDQDQIRELVRPFDEVMQEKLKLE